MMESGNRLFFGTWIIICQRQASCGTMDFYHPDRESGPMSHYRKVLKTRLRVFLICCGVFILGLMPHGVRAATPIVGECAVPGGMPGVVGEMVAVSAGMETDIKLDITFRRPQETNPLKKYHEDLGQQMHIIAVSDDFKIFIHRHVTHMVGGHGQVRIRFPKPGHYSIYADGIPYTLSRQVVRFPLTVGTVEGDEGTDDETPMATTGSVTMGPYQIALDRFDLAANAPTVITAHILENDKPAKDLRPYLGVPAHAILIGVDDLSYTHAHAGSQSPTGGKAAETADRVMNHEGHAMMPDDANVSPDLSFSITAPHPGTYRMFIQFDGRRMIYTVPFTMTAH